MNFKIVITSIENVIVEAKDGSEANAIAKALYERGRNRLSLQDNLRVEVLPMDDAERPVCGATFKGAYSGEVGRCKMPSPCPVHAEKAISDFPTMKTHPPTCGQCGAELTALGHGSWACQKCFMVRPLTEKRLGEKEKGE